MFFYVDHQLPQELSAFLSFGNGLISLVVLAAVVRLFRNSEKAGSKLTEVDNLAPSPVWFYNTDKVSIQQ